MKHTQRTHRQQGSVLITVIVLLIIAAMSVVALTLTLQDYARAQAKDRKELQAFYAAEAGCHEVMAWMNTRGVGAPPAIAPYFTPDSTGNFPMLAANIGSGIDIAAYGSQYLPVLRDASGKEVARVTDLKILPPVQPDPPIDRLLCIVRSVGQAARSGNTKVAELYLAVPVSLDPLTGAPAAIMSYASTSFGGNMKVHWGEVWSLSNINMPNKSQMGDNQTQDPYKKYRTEGQIEFNSTWKADKWGKPYASGTYGTIVNPSLTTLNMPCDAVAYGSIGSDYGQMMYQRASLKWPKYDYELIKSIAKSKGRYFVVDASGKLYRDGIVDAAHRVTFEALNVSGVAPNRSNWDDIEYDVVMVDTIAGVKPTPSTPLPTISISGSGVNWKGLYYICANLDMSGLGTGSIPAIPMVREDGLVNTKDGKVFMDGLLVLEGSFSGTGNGILYGACYIERGYSGTGTIDVWYNVALRDGFPRSPIMSNVSAARWKFRQ